ncbi:MAG: PadR family transcriptional regulator [Marmoricola sp.]
MARRGDSLEMAVLGLLHESPLHGYELRKRLNLLLGWSRLLSYGSLYPALKKMLRAGWVTDEVVPMAAVRRTRITYQITPAGREHFGAQMTDSGPSSWEDDNFDVRFVFFSRTDHDVRLRILEGRRSRLQERLDRVRTSHGPSSDRGDRYAAELHRHSLESVERELTWLNGLIDVERQAQDRRGPQPVAVPDAATRGDSTIPPSGTTAGPPRRQAPHPDIS